MSCVVNLIYCFMQLATLVMLIKSVFSPQFQPRAVKNLTWKTFNLDYCIEIGDVSEHCGYLDEKAIPLNKFFAGCGNRPRYFDTASYCALISFIFIALELMIGSIYCCFKRCSVCCVLKFLCMALNVTSIVTLAICWGVMLDQYLHSNGYRGPSNMRTSDPCVRLRDYTGQNNNYINGMRLGSGLILLVICWIINLISLTMLCMPFNNNYKDIWPILYLYRVNEKYKYQHNASI